MDTAMLTAFEAVEKVFAAEQRDHSSVSVSSSPQ